LAVGGKQGTKLKLKGVNQSAGKAQARAGGGAGGGARKRGGKWLVIGKTVLAELARAKFNSIHVICIMTHQHRDVESRVRA
jgi:hypothetical protein